jgi:tetratricopeptide (TPR) repeat protein
VYAVLPAKASAPRPRVFPYSPYFDLSLFPQAEGNPDWEDEGTREVERKVIGSIAKYNQAVALMERKEYQKAIPLLSGILAIFPELERANYYLGECLRQVGEKEKAVAYFDRSIANNPEDWPSYIAKVYLLDERDQLPEAVRTVISALSIDPNQKEFYSLLGYLYLRRNKRLEGINKFLELANLFPHTPFPHLYCGYLYAENNDLEKAEREFIKAKEKNPEEADVYSALGSLYLQKGEKERARAFFQKSLSLNPNQPALLKTLQSRDQVLPDKEGRPMP